MHPLLFACPLVSLLIQTLPLGNPPEYDYALAGGGDPASPFTRTVTLDLDGDTLQDVFVLHGQTVDMFMGPGLYEAFLPGVAQGNDLAALELGAGDRALLTVGAAGAVKLEFDWGPGNPPTEQWTSTPIESSIWDDAQLVETRWCPEDASQRIFGVLADGTSVHALIDLGSGYQDTPLFSTTAPILDLAVLEWGNAGNHREVAAMTAGGLEVFEYVSGAVGTPQTWQSIYSYQPPGFTGVALETGRQGGGAEWLAWIATWTGTNKQLLAIVDASGTTASPWFPGDPGIVGLATGDWVGESPDDIALSYQSDHAIRVLRNLGTTSPVFDVTTESAQILVDLDDTSVYPHAVTPVPENEAEPAFVDVDNNGTLDFVFPVEGDGMLYVHRSGPSFAFPLEDLVEAEDPIRIDDSECSTTLLHLNVRMPQSFPSGANGIECALFRRPDGQATSYTDPVAIDSYRARTAGFTSGEVVDEFLLDIQTNAAFGEIFFWVQWPVELDAADNVIQVFTPQTYGFEAEGGASTVNEDFLLDMANGDPFDVEEVDCPGPNGDTVVGTGVPLPCLPDFPPGRMPVIPRS